MYCFYTAGVRPTFALYNLLDPGTSSHRKHCFENYFIFSKLILLQPVLHSRVYFSINLTLHKLYCIIVKYLIIKVFVKTVSGTVSSWPAVFNFTFPPLPPQEQDLIRSSWANEHSLTNSLKSSWLNFLKI